MRKSTPERDREIFTVMHFAADVSTAELARLSGLAYNTVANLRRPVRQGGTRNPTNRTLSAIGRACGMKRIWVEATDRRSVRIREERAHMSAMH